MAFDYARAQATAARLIANFGQTASLIQRTATGPSYDPTIVETSHNCTLVVLDYEQSKIDGTLIKATDRRVFLSTEGLTVSPDTQDKLTIGGTVYSIVAIMPLSPAGTVVLWEIQARS